MTKSRLLKWTAGLLVAPVLVAALLIAIFGWNWLRGPIEHQIGSATGRSFAINGDLEVHLSLRPRIVANDVVLGNAAWSGEPAMARARRLDFRIDILKLLAGIVEIPEMALSEPHVVLEINKDGEPNWAFNGQDKNKPVEFPVIGALTVDHGNAIYRDPREKTELALEIKTLEGGKDNPDTGLEVAGKGRYKGLPATLHAQGGALLSLRDAAHPYPIKASAVLGTINVGIDGMLLDPLRLRGEQMNFRIEGGDLEQLFPLLGIPFPPTPAYKLAGFLDHSGDVWTFHRFKGTVGRSDIAGEFTVDRAKRPQFITATLVSNRLRMKDLGGFIGADHAEQPQDAPARGDRVLPNEPFSLEKLRAADADVTFHGEKILTGKIPLKKMSAHLLVKNGVLKLAPLNFDVAGGNLVMQIEMDGRKPRIATRADITAKGLHLGQLFQTSTLAAADTGTMGGRAKLEGNGNSVAQMLASSNGEAALIMDGGSVSELMLRLSNLDIANSVARMLGGDRQVPIQCMVANFNAVDGDFKVEALVLDTPKVNMTGSGDVNFIDESIHLRLVSHSKGFSLASFRGPIAITGTFRNPVVKPELGAAVARGGLAVALGIVTAGIGTLIPLLDFGTGGGKDRDSNCAALISKAQADAGVKASDLAPRVQK